ncbi:hypothetical protein DFJ77DRAFT_453245 [Powellomyces hirtus]|nr:hypothetical protein DFJ77DRAFT_453245 [Powellomyces hirtus]
MTTVFLDHNPTAFAVLVDFLRYGRWFVPPAVNRHLVDRLAWDLLGEVVHTDAEANGEAPVPVANLAPRTDVKDGAVPAGDSIAQGRRGSNNSQASLAPPSYSLLPPSHTASSSRNVPPSSSPLQTLVNSVLLPLLATHSTRGHAAVNLIMAPRAVTKSAIVTAEFLEVKIPFEIVHLLQDKDMNAITLIGSDLVNVDGGSSSSAANLDALTCFPTLEFVMQTATRNYLCASLRGAAMHPVHAVKSSVVELTLRTCNEMGLYDSSRVEAVVLRVELHASEETSA